MNYATIANEAKYIAEMFIKEQNQMKADGLWNSWNADALNLRQVRDICDHKMVNGAAAYRFIAAIKAASVNTFIDKADKKNAERLLEGAQLEIDTMQVQPQDLDELLVLTAQTVLHYMVIDEQIKATHMAA